MLPDDVTQPMRNPPEHRAPWPDRPPQSPLTSRPAYRPAQRPSRLPWALLGFVGGVILTAIVMLMIFSPPNVPAIQPTAKATALKLTLTDALLTQELTAHSGQADANVSQMRAHVESSNDIAVSGIIQTNGGTTAPFSVTLKPYVASDHTLKVNVTRASIGGLTIPPSTLDELVGPLNQRLAGESTLSMGAGKPLVINDVQFADGAMTLVYSFAS